jgi:hypothetical protein
MAGKSLEKPGQDEGALAALVSNRALNARNHGVPAAARDRILSVEFSEEKFNSDCT